MSCRRCSRESVNWQPSDRNREKCIKARIELGERPPALRCIRGIKLWSRDVVDLKDLGTLLLGIDRNPIPGNSRWQFPSQSSHTPTVT